MTIKQSSSEVLKVDTVGRFGARERFLCEQGLHVKNPGASPEAFKNMNSQEHETKPKQASGYQTHRDEKLRGPFLTCPLAAKK
jgi:hypothetical protein